MDILSYQWLKLTTWYHTNVGPGRYGYQVFDWWVVDEHISPPDIVAYILQCDIVFNVGPYFFLKRNMI